MKYYYRTKRSVWQVVPTLDEALTEAKNLLRKWYAERGLRAMTVGVEIVVSDEPPSIAAVYADTKRTKPRETYHVTLVYELGRSRTITPIRFEITHTTWCKTIEPYTEGAP